MPGKNRRKQGGELVEGGMKYGLEGLYEGIPEG